MVKADEKPKKQRRPARTPRTGRPKKAVVVPHYTLHVRVTPEIITRLQIEQERFHTRGLADTARMALTEIFGFHVDAARVLRVPISFDQDRWLADEQRRLGCATRTDAIRAILDEARARG